MDLLLVPYWADRDLELMQWPPFLLASKVSFDHLFPFYIRYLLSMLVVGAVVVPYFPSWIPDKLLNSFSSPYFSYIG